MTVLACVDDSDVARVVIAHAARLARESGLTLEVTRVLDPLLDLVQGPGSTSEIIAQVSERWRGSMAELVRETGGGAAVSVTVLNPRERVHQAIARVAAERNARAIVIGSHGAGLIRHTIMGSVAMGVVGEATCPVVIAGPAATMPVAGDRYSILACSDGSESSGRMLDELGRLASGTPLSIALLTIYEPRLGDAGEQDELDAIQRELDAMRARLPEANRGPALVRTIGDFERVDAAITRVASEEGAGAIAMATRGHSVRRHLLVGSVAVGVLKHSSLPVMLIRA